MKLLALLLALTLPAACQPAPQPVRTAAFRGMLYRPAANPRSLAIVFLGGSEGHLYLAEEIAPQLAAAGYTTLAVDYHDGFDPGRKLDLVPIETFTSAVAWLKASPIHPAAVAILGDSRGSEAALLTASYEPGIAAVLALVPSSILWGATDNSDSRHSPAWSWQGKPLPCANCFLFAADFSAILDTLSPASPARIPVEHIHGPIFLAGSDSDAVWPSARMAREIAARLHQHQFAWPVTLLTFPDSSHQLLGTGPRDPIATYQFGGKTYTMDSGGTASGTLRARNQTWEALLAFLATIPAPAPAPSPAPAPVSTPPPTGPHS